MSGQHTDPLRRGVRHAGLIVALAGVVWVLARAPTGRHLEQRAHEAGVATFTTGEAGALGEGVAALALLPPATRRRVLLDTRVRDAFVGGLAAASPQAMEDTLTLMQGLDAEWRSDVLRQPAASTAVADHYRARVLAEFDPDRGRLDLPRARREVQTLARLYPGTTVAAPLEAELEAARAAAEARLKAEYETLLAADAFLTAADRRALPEVLAALVQVAGARALADDPRRVERLAALIAEALDAGRPGRAAALLDAGERLDPGHPRLATLAARRTGNQARRAAHSERAALSAEVARQGETLHDLEDFRASATTLAMLSDLSPEDTAARDLRWQLEQMLGSEVARALARGDAVGAEALLVEFAPAIGLDALRALREQVLAAGGTTPGSSGAAGRAGFVREVNALLARPLLDGPWQLRFTTSFSRYLATSDPDSPRVETVLRTVELLHADRARAALEAGDPALARHYLERGLRWRPDSAALADLAALARRAIPGAP